MEARPFPSPDELRLDLGFLNQQSSEEIEDEIAIDQHFSDAGHTSSQQSGDPDHISNKMETPEPKPTLVLVICGLSSSLSTKLREL